MYTYYLIHSSTSVLTLFMGLMCNFHYDYLIHICLCGVQDMKGCCLLYYHDPPISLKDTKETNISTSSAFLIESKMCTISSYMYFNHHINWKILSAWASKHDLIYSSNFVNLTWHNFTYLIDYKNLTWHIVIH